MNSYTGKARNMIDCTRDVSFDVFDWWLCRTCQARSLRTEGRRAGQHTLKGAEAAVSGCANSSLTITYPDT